MLALLPLLQNGGYPLPFAALGWRCQCSTNDSAVMVLLFLFFFRWMDSDLTKERLAGFRPVKRGSATRDVVACCMLEWALEKRNDDEMPTLVL